MLSFFSRKRPPPKDLEEYLYETYRMKRDELEKAEDIFSRLGLSGDDCFVFMEDISRFFGVNFSKYDWTKYHYMEAEEMELFQLFRAFYAVIGKPWPPSDRKMYPISGLHLLKVYRDKCWTDPDPMPPAIKRRSWLASLRGR